MVQRIPGTNDYMTVNLEPKGCPFWNGEKCCASFYECSFHLDCFFNPYSLEDYYSVYKEDSEAFVSLYPHLLEDIDILAKKVKEGE